MLRRLAFAVALTMIPSAGAASYDVSGVEWGDVLNIRTAPDAKSAIAGAIPYDGRGVEVTAQAKNGWAKVIYRSTTGYVLAKYLTPTQADGPLPAKLSCHGTEPFWTIEISPKGSTYQLMDGAKEPLNIGAFMSAANRSDVWMATGNKTAVQVSRGTACSNGMSDEVFPYTVTATTPGGDGVVSGCCK